MRNVYVVRYEDQPNLNGNVFSSAAKALSCLAEYGEIEDPTPRQTLYDGAAVEVAAGRAYAVRLAVR